MRILILYMSNKCRLFQCDNHEIRPGKYLGVCISVANNRLFVGSIPKNKTRESILEDFGKVTGHFQRSFTIHRTIRANHSTWWIVVVLPNRGSARGDIVSTARRQEEEPRILFSWVRGPQVRGAGSPPPHEWQGQGLGEPSHRGVGWPRGWAWPGGHGQGGQGCSSSLVFSPTKGWWISTFSS